MTFGNLKPQISSMRYLRKATSRLLFPRGKYSAATRHSPI